ncbi:hypothetical protein K0M31_004218 [Melipona bicolor]|uniref:Uncharacterized protein n=1 Tax=Melipona bicolor TaxID=60889 RepID=A0AA40KN33_9HYME|nr:hypothetical protein K0M31_004218 [Melipona bicolor]
MVLQTRFIFLLLLPILFTTGFASPLDVAEDSSNVRSEKVSAKINKLFDMMLPSIHNFIQTHGLDPLKLQDLSEKLVVDLTTRVLNLTNGWLQGLSDVRRANDIILSYQDKVITVDATLAFDVVDANYKYLLKDLLISKKGQVRGRIRNMQLRIIIELDMKNYKLAVPMAKIINVDKFNVIFEGNKDDPLMNAVAKAITDIFRTTIINIVNQEFSKEMKILVDEINKKIPRPDRLFDYSNVWHYV